MDDLKKYLQNHRSELDHDLPGDAVWTSIRKDLHPVSSGKVISIKVKWMIAACFILLAGTGAYLLINQTTVTSEAMATNDYRVVEPLVFTPTITAPAAEQAPSIKKDALLVKRSVKKTAPKTATGTAPVKPQYGFENVEYSYASMLDMQLERIRTQPIYAESADYFSLFKKQFSDLENDEHYVKKSIRKTGMTDERLNLLINIYQQKMSVLKELQFEINKMNNRIKQINPGVQQKHPTYMNI